MKRLSLSEILNNIHAERPFESVMDDYSFSVKVESYEPYVCGAVHDGNQFRKELWEKCLHTDYERWFEEDPSTKEFVKSHPIVIAGCDSRFEYDLNRAPEDAIYRDAWGKKLWKTALTKDERTRSLRKHSNFYKVVDALISKLEEKHNKVIVYDMHSYNWRRWEREVPVINLGTSNIDNDRFGELVELWRRSLEKLELPHGIDTDAKINDTFQGNGYFLKYITKNFQNTLVLATEFKKIYCDERSGIIYPEVVSTIEKQLREKIKDHANRFQELAK